MFRALYVFTMTAIAIQVLIMLTAAYMIQDHFRKPKINVYWKWRFNQLKEREVERWM